MKRNRDMFHNTAESDILVQMQERIKELVEKNKPFCIMDILGEIEPCIRCTKFQMDCKECIYAWLNEEKV